MNGGDDMSEEMEKYGYDPKENENFDEILELLSGTKDKSPKDVREQLRADPLYEEHFSTTKQQQYLHMIFDKLNIDLKELLLYSFGFTSTKLLFKNEISVLIDENKEEYDRTFNLT